MAGLRRKKTPPANHWDADSKFFDIDFCPVNHPLCACSRLFSRSIRVHLFHSHKNPHFNTAKMPAMTDRPDNDISNVTALSEDEYDPAIDRDRIRVVCFA